MWVGFVIKVTLVTGTANVHFKTKEGVNRRSLEDKLSLYLWPVRNRRRMHGKDQTLAGHDDLQKLKMSTQ